MAGNFQAFNIGKDMLLQINLHNTLSAAGLPNALDTATLFDVSNLGLLENFEASPVHSTIETRPISHGGQKFFRDRFDEWKGSFDIVRTGMGVDFLVQILQDALLAPNGGAIYCDMTQTVYDPLGNATGNGVFQFSNVILAPSNGGKFTADSPVMYTFEFRASRRDIVSSATNGAVASEVTQLQTLAAALALVAAPSSAS